jgi:hypothetical protein
MKQKLYFAEPPKQLTRRDLENRREHLYHAEHPRHP